MTGADEALGDHARTRHAADTGRPTGIAGHELLLDPLTCYIMNQCPERVIAGCVAKQRIVPKVQSIDCDYEQAGEQDDMREILELRALPWRDHVDYRSHEVS